MGAVPDTMDAVGLFSIGSILITVNAKLYSFVGRIPGGGPPVQMGVGAAAGLASLLIYRKVWHATGFSDH